VVTAREIKSFKLFSGLAEKELKGIAALCHRQTFKANTIIIDPDKPNENLYIVEDENEAIQIEVPIRNRTDKLVIHTLSKGETFGWSAIVSQHIKTTVTRCISPVTVISINSKKLMQYLEQDHHIGYIVMKNLVEILGDRLTYTTVSFRHEIRVSRGNFKSPVSK
jgi:CRP/FNR family cyclic AMP-dependent transcriptional regulator